MIAVLNESNWGFMRILIMGGTRFIGVHLTQILVEQGHEVVLFNRGNLPAPVPQVKTIIGDRTDATELKDKLATEDFDIIFEAIFNRFLILC